MPSCFISSMFSWHIVRQSTKGVITPSVICVESPFTGETQRALLLKKIRPYIFSLNFESLGPIDDALMCFSNFLIVLD